jgi:hypothetical protein
MMGALFFVIYAALFNALSIESGIVGWSALLGLVHGAIAGTGDGDDARHASAHGDRRRPSPDEGVPNPGLFASSFGVMGPMAILALHLVCGVVGGLVYNA